MEWNSNDKTSENDRKMMGSFEEFADKSEEKEDKKKKSKEKAAKNIFGKTNEEEKPEKRGNIFEPKKPEKTPEEKEKPEEAEEDKTAETEPAEQEMSGEEMRYAAEQYVDAQKESLSEELGSTEPGSPEEASVLADAALIEAISDELENDETLDEAKLDELFTETAEGLGFEADDGEDEEASEEESGEEEPPTNQTFTAPSTPKSAPPPTSLPPAAPPPAAPPPGTGSGSIPPFGGPFQPVTNTLPASPNVAPEPKSPNVLRRHNRGADLLVGGIVGYMIGRRRGRIKTEEQLLPVQEKLEREVTDLHSQIAEREKKIRNLVEQKVQKTPEAERPTVAERIIERITGRSENQPETFEKPEKPERISEEKLQQPVFERLGGVLVPAPETAADEPAEKLKDPATLTLTELLEVADNIEVENRSLRQLYEAKNLDTQGLRRVVAEYLRGGNYERVMSDAMVAEKSPERMAHDKYRDEPTAWGVGSSGQTADDDEAQTPAQTNGPVHQADAYRSAQTPLYGHKKAAAGNLKQQVKNRLITVVAVAVVLILLLAVML